jgi:hypothetical protein
VAHGWIRNVPEGAHELLARALSIDEKAYGPEHPKVVERLSFLPFLLCQLKKEESLCSSFLERALSIDEKAYGAEHPKVAQRLAGLADVFKEQGRSRKRACSWSGRWRSTKRRIGVDHPRVAKKLSALADLLDTPDLMATARGHRERALSIMEKIYHPGPQQRPRPALPAW